MKNTNDYPKIVAAHLLNDFSGSPLVFSQSLQILIDEGFEVHLLSGTTSKSGFLSHLKVIQHPINYGWSKNPLLTLFRFLFSQMIMFYLTLKIARRKDIVYINTILPFGVALAGWLKGCKIVYHLHEVSVRPILLKQFLFTIIRCTADYCIYVSKYVKENTNIHVPGEVIYNSLPEDFIKKARSNKHRDHNNFTVLMLCSMKMYKGVFQFITCARQMPHLNFILVLNASAENVAAFFRDVDIPGNVSIHPEQSDVHIFYANASIVVNLSQPEKWIETFGMTALEGMYYRRPVIVPKAGGNMEFVRDNVCGFLVNSGDVAEITDKILLLSENKDLYESMSDAAYARASRFTSEIFRAEILHMIQLVIHFDKRHQNEGHLINTEPS